ncbi:MAG: hypothetical protein WBF73_07540 [Bradyrhizobium sp.]|jgi:hypothetical protein
MAENRKASAMVLVLVGIVMMAFCGQSHSNRIGGTSWELAGFAVGILLIANAWIFELRKRVSELENKLSATNEANRDARPK